MQGVDRASKTRGRAPVGSVRLAFSGDAQEFEFRHGGEFQNSATLSTFGHFDSVTGPLEKTNFLKKNKGKARRSRQETSSATSAAPTTTIVIDETHAAQLARHLAELYKRRRFTDLKVP